MISPHYASDPLLGETSLSRATMPTPASALSSNPNFLSPWLGLVLERSLGCLAYNPPSYFGRLPTANELWWGTEAASQWKAEKARHYLPSRPCSQPWCEVCARQLHLSFTSDSCDIGKQGLSSLAALLTDAVAQRLREAEPSARQSAVSRAERQGWGVTCGMGHFPGCVALSPIL